LDCHCFGLAVGHIPKDVAMLVMVATVSGC
jgi:hypothetical protein